MTTRVQSHPLRLDRCPSLAGAGEGGRRPGEGRREKTRVCGEDRGEVSKFRFPLSPVALEKAMNPAPIRRPCSASPATTTGLASRKAWPASISSSNNSKCPPPSINNQLSTINSSETALACGRTTQTRRQMDRTLRGMAGGQRVFEEAVNQYHLDIPIWHFKLSQA